MSCKRSLEGQDPDYQDDSENDNKRLRVLEKDSAAATVKKIEKIILEQFTDEMKLKETELDAIDERLYEARQMLDQLRAGIIISFYSNIDDNSAETSAGLKSESRLPTHPALKKLLGKGSSTKQFSVLPKKLSNAQLSSTITQPQIVAKKAPETVTSAMVETKLVSESSKEYEDSVRGGRFRVKKQLVIGNISKYISVDQREGHDATHRWMMYVRGPKDDPSIHGFVSKVIFFLHPSYRPNDRVEVTQPPFHLTHRGWGQFQVRVQLHFRDPRNKPLDVYHQLKLDQTFTGLQTWGGETKIDISIFKEDASSCGDRKQIVKQNLYAIPSDTGGISIPADEEGGTSARSTQDNTQVPSIEIKKEKIDPSYEDNRGESCAVSSFINDHGNYFNQNVKKDELSKDSDLTKTNILSIKQEPPDHFNNHKVNSVSILNLSNSKLAKKNAGNVIPVTNKLHPNSINIINSNFKLAPHNQTVLTLPNKNNSILMVPQIVGNASKSKDTEVKKFPCSSNSSSNTQTTLVKYSCNQGNIFLITVPKNNQKTQETSFNATESVRLNAKTGNESLVSNISGICKLKWTNSTNKQAEINSKHDTKICCNIDEFEDFSSAIRYTGKKFPIINPNIDRTMFPYSAKSMEQFFSWNVGKRHSSEWQRARSVREKLLELVKKSTKWKCEDVWTIKQIYVWLRRHGYSPVKTDESNLEAEKQLGRFNLNSGSEPTKLLEDLAIQQKELSVKKEICDEEEEDEIIDVMNVTEENRSQSVQKKSSPSKSSSSVYVDSNEEGVIVKDACRQIGIDLHPENVYPEVAAPLAEAALLCAMKLFLEDVMGLALAEKFKKLENKCPSCLDGFDVASAISKFPLADFVTHKGLGVKINSKSILNAKDIKL